MLIFFKARVDPKDMNFDEMWDVWEKEVDAAFDAMEAGKIKALYKVVGQRRVIGIFDAESHDELDRVFMAGLPLAHYLEFEEISPVREYTSFGNDVKNRWA